MAKQQKPKAKPIEVVRKNRGPRKPDFELVKKPVGMCKVLFKDLAPYLALEIKNRKRERDTRKKR